MIERIGIGFGAVDGLFVVDIDAGIRRRWGLSLALLAGCRHHWPSYSCFGALQNQSVYTLEATAHPRAALCDF